MEQEDESIAQLTLDGVFCDKCGIFIEGPPVYHTKICQECVKSHNVKYHKKRKKNKNFVGNE